MFLRDKRAARFEALQHCLVPRSRRFTESQRQASRDLINGILVDKPPLVHRKIALFLFLIDVVAVFYGLRSFAHLSRPRQRRVMDFFFDSKVALLRKGFWGVNTLAKLGIYGQPSVYGEIGYVKRALAGEPRDERVAV